MTNNGFANKSFDVSGRKCSDCARFKVPDAGCPWAGEVSASDAACAEFYPRQEKQKREKPQHRACGLSDQGSFEAIYHNGKPAFMVLTDEGFKIAETLINEGHVIAPKDLSEIPYEPYGFYEGPVPSLEELFQKIRSEFDLFLDVDPIYKDFLAACVLLSYQQEKVRTVPYVYFYGDNESGKTVALTLLSLLCYRPLFGVTIPAADIYGYLDDSDAPGVILEDEVQGLHKDQDKSKIYKAGYKYGAKVPRTFILQHKRFIKYFRCFCFKACAAEEIPRVKGLAERFIFIPMMEGSPKKDWANVNEEDLKRIKQLRDILLKWRLATVDQGLPDVELPCKGRLAELWKPIIQVVSGLPVEKELRAFLDRLQQERLNEKMNTLEGRLAKVVLELYDGHPLPFTSIWNHFAMELEAPIDYKRPNELDTSEFGVITKRQVGYRLREVLGGRKRSFRSADGSFTKAYEFDQEKLKRIARKYGVDIVSKCLMCPTIEAPSTEKTMEKVHEFSMENVAETPLQIGHIRHTDTKLEQPVNIEIETPTAISGNKPLLDMETLPAKLERLTTNVIDKCMNPGCRYTGRMDWQATYPDGSWALLCYDCGLNLFRKIKEAQSDGE